MKKLPIIISLLLTIGVPVVASAHTYSGALGSIATATDKWSFVCRNTKNASLQFRIQRNFGTPCVKATSNVTPFPSKTSCGAYSSYATVSTGPGTKVFTVNKSPAIAGVVKYTVEAHCINVNGVHASSDQSEPQVYIQNQ